MSCKNCEKFQESKETCYYRWGTANIEVRACQKHLKEVFAALNKIQGGKVCPTCTQTYFAYPALSRKDNKTEICPGCGVLEALSDYAKHKGGGKV